MAGGDGSDAMFGGAACDVLRPERSNAEPSLRAWWDIVGLIGDLFSGGARSTAPAPRSASAGEPPEEDVLVVTAARRGPAHRSRRMPRQMRPAADLRRFWISHCEQGDP
jgi:hypothetical protein